MIIRMVARIAGGTESRVNGRMAGGTESRVDGRIIGCKKKKDRWSDECFYGYYDEWKDVG